MEQRSRSYKRNSLIGVGPKPGQRTGGLWNWVKGNKGKAALIGGGILGSTLPFLGGDEDEDEIIDDWSLPSSSIANLRNQARDYYKSGT